MELTKFKCTFHDPIYEFNNIHNSKNEIKFGWKNCKQIFLTLTESAEVYKKLLSPNMAIHSFEKKYLARLLVDLSLTCV